MLSAEEIGHLLTDRNATTVDYPADATLPSLLADQAAATPDAEALVCGATTLTYAELNSRANQLAHWLIEQGTQPDDLVGPTVFLASDLAGYVTGASLLVDGGAYVNLQ